MDKRQTTTTHHQIGKTTYIVVAAPSDGAKERFEAKIDRLLKKDLRHSERLSESQ